MEQELNIAAILRDKPYAKLWSPIIGVCELNHINSSSDINVTIKAGIYYNGSAIYSMTFNSRGKYGGEFKDNTVERECMLFPSKSMRDWSKFAWKKGDVLEYTEGEQPYYAIFEAFQDDEYTAFKSRYNFNGGNHWLQFNSQSSTNHFTKVSDEEAKAFIEKVEENYGGKLNLDTLKIEKPQFEAGDIISISSNASKLICIFKTFSFEDYNYVECYIELNAKSNYLYDGYVKYDLSVYKVRSATDSERQLLFDALAKENKAWDAEKKQIVDLPKMYEFKPLDYVLLRLKNWEEPQWQLFQYAYETDGSIHIVGSAYGFVKYNTEVLPYNEETAHLLGTTDDWKGGEG